MEKDTENNDEKKRDKKKQGWFKKWFNHVEKMEQWDELSHGCLFFPYASCY